MKALDMILLIGYILCMTILFTKYLERKFDRIEQHMGACEELESILPMRDYQLELHMDTVWVYDGERLVGQYINTKWNSQLDSIILKDNE